MVFLGNIRMNTLHTGDNDNDDDDNDNNNNDNNNIIIINHLVSGTSMCLYCIVLWIFRFLISAHIE